MKFIDLIGQKFGKLLVLKRAENKLRKDRIHGITQFKCKCDCGNETIKTSSYLIDGTIKNPSCGCIDLRRTQIDLTGKKIGMLYVIKKTDVPENKKYSGGERTFYLCRCDCSKEVVVVSSSLLKPNKPQQSCGCSRAILDIEIIKLRAPKQVYKNCYSDGYLSFDEFYSLSQHNCYYCGMQPANEYNIFTRFKDKSKQDSLKIIAKTALINGEPMYNYGNFIYNGLDRLDSNLPHNRDNVVPCCKTCNRAKMATPANDFIAWIERAYNHLKKNDIIK